jgi:hypothetical protein
VFELFELFALGSLEWKFSRPNTGREFRHSIALVADCTSDLGDPWRCEGPFFGPLIWAMVYPAFK